ncbi:MAG TPA: hypothetical protein VN980_04825 [Alphaproteobacteria bacterium]|nr:hypothetical protein [Alphaproteobacteria bacterium]
MSKLTREELIGILGRLDDVKLASVMALAPTKDEVIQAKLWLTHTDLRDAGARAAPSVKVTRIYDMLRADTPLDWDE